MRDSVTPVLRDLAHRLTGTLDLGTRWAGHTYRRTSETVRFGVRSNHGTDTMAADRLRDQPRTVLTPHPMRAAPERDWKYRPSEVELAMRARRLITQAEFPGDIRGRVEMSSTTVRLFRSDDGKLYILKPISGENNPAIGEIIHPALAFMRSPGALTNREIAAYRVSELLGFKVVPPTAWTDGVIGLDGRQRYPGMIQQFVESDPAREPRDYPVEQQQQVAVLDYIIGALDRGPQNWRTVDRGTHLDVVAIDHGRSFPLSIQPLKVAIYSDFVAAQKGQTLVPEVLRGVKNVDMARFQAALGDAGLQPNAIAGAVARLKELQELEKIP